MKKLIIVAGLMAAATVLVQAQNREVRNVGSFDEVKVGESVRLVLVPGNKNEVLVETDGVEVDKVETSVSGGQLRIGMSRGTWRSFTVTVTVTFKELNGVKCSSSARVNSKGTIDSNDFYVDVSSSGRVNLDVNVEKLKVEVSSSGRIELSGSATTQVVQASSSGRYSAFGLDSEGVKVDVSSSGRVEVNVSKEIYADASSSGRVSYKGSPEKVIADTSSSGKISRAQ